MNKLKQIPEFLRFVMVGLFATGLHYGIYFDTYRIVESLSAVGFFPSVGSHPSVSHCHSGKFFISEVCFQTKVISLRSLYDSEE